MLGKQVLATMLLTLLAFSASATVIYKWVDKNGVTHYSQEPPEEALAETLHSKDIEPPKTGYIAPQVRADAPPEPTDLEKSAVLIKEKDAKQAQSICESATHSLNVLTSYTRLNRQSENGGEPVAMTEEERQAAIKEQQERIRLFCQ